jgi:hypothetical protein
MPAQIMNTTPSKQSRRSSGIERLQRKLAQRIALEGAEQAAYDEVAQLAPVHELEEAEGAVYRSLSVASPQMPAEEMSRRAKTQAALSVAKSSAQVEVSFATVVNLVNQISESRGLLDASQIPAFDKDENMAVPDGVDMTKGMISVAEKNIKLLYELLDAKPYNHEECPVCLSAFEPDEPTTVTACRHKFCIDCLSDWCKACESNLRCPLCVQPIAAPADAAATSVPVPAYRVSQMDPADQAWPYRSFPPGPPLSNFPHGVDFDVEEARILMSDVRRYRSPQRRVSSPLACPGAPVRFSHHAALGRYRSHHEYFDEDEDDEPIYRSLNYGVR